MANAEDVRPGQEIVGADGIHVGIVDAVEGDDIILAGRDSSEDGGRAANAPPPANGHRLRLALIDRVEGNKAYLAIDAARAAIIDAIGEEPA